MRRHAVQAAMIVGAFVLAGCSGSGSGGSSSSAEYPNGDNVRMLVGFATGGSTDLAARHLAGYMESSCGMPTTVENLSTGGGLEAVSRLVASEPDGYTVALTPMPASNMLYLDSQRGARFTRDEIDPIATHDASPLVIAVAGGSPFQTLEDMLSAARTNPESVTVSSNGVLAAGHLALLQLNKTAGTDIAWTPFEESGLMRTAVLGGDIQAEINGIAEVTEPAKSGDMRILAVLTEERLPEYPDVPTATEQGVEVLSASTRVLSGPAGLPENVATVLEKCVQDATSNAEYAAKAAELGLTLDYQGTAETQAAWDATDATYAPLVDEFRSSEGG